MDCLNVITVEIKNCLDCPHSLVSDIFTADSWDHEMGCFCKKAVDEKYKKDWTNITRSGVLPYRCVGSDDWHLRKYTDVPDWCPYKQQEVIE